MKGDPLPLTDHIARLCKRSCIDEEGWPAPTAFMKRLPAEDFVSVNWLEILGLANKADQVSKVKEILVSKLPNVNNSSKIALLNVGDTISLVTANIPNFELPVLHEPTIKAEVVIDDSHSGIYNLPFPGEDLSAAELVARSVKEVLPFK